MREAAVLGAQVYNFDYNANSDGTYSCKTRVMGPGAMAESMRINRSTGYGFTVNPIDADTSYTSDLENALFAIKEHLKLIHQDVSKGTCDKCSTVFKNSSELYGHFLQIFGHHMNMKAEEIFSYF